MLEESIGDHCHESVTVKALPGSSLEVVETEFLLELLMGLLADPSGFDGGSEVAQPHSRGQVGEIVLPFPRWPVFADEPSFLARQMLLALVPDPLRRACAYR